MKPPKEKYRLWENDSLLTSEYEQKEYFDLGRIIKKDDCNIRDDIGGEMHYLKVICNDQVDRVVDAMGPYDIFEK